MHGLAESRIYLSVPPNRQDLTQSLYYNEDLGEKVFGHKQKLELYWTTLDIGLIDALSSTLAFAKSTAHMPADPKV